MGSSFNTLNLTQFFEVSNRDIPACKKASLLGLPLTTYIRYAKKLGCYKKYVIKHTTPHPKYKYNIHYFDKLDSQEKAYFLGFIAADGTVNKSNHLKISIKDSDKEVLLNFCEELHYPKDAIHIYKSKTAIKDYTYDFKSANLGIYSAHIGTTLNFYGIVKNKTYANTNFLKNIPDKYKAAWLTGYIDGDGSISKRGWISLILNKPTSLELCKFLAKKGIYMSATQKDFKNDAVELTACNYMSNLLLSILYIYSNTYHLTRKLERILHTVSLYGDKPHKNLNTAPEKVYPFILAEYKDTNRRTYNYTHTGKYKVTICKDCGKKIYNGATYCLSCWNRQKSAHLPTRDVLKQDIRNNSFLQVAKKYNVSDNAIRKWCKKYNLPYKSTEIKKYSDEEWAVL